MEIFMAPKYFHLETVWISQVHQLDDGICKERMNSYCALDSQNVVEQSYSHPECSNDL